MHNRRSAVWNHTLSRVLDERIETLNGDSGFAGEHCVKIVGISRPYPRVGRRIEMVPG